MRAAQNNRVAVTPVVLEVKDTPDENAAAPYIVWNWGEDASVSNVWNYTIYNLERYAPNGMPYIYTLSEKQVDGYKQADFVSAQADQADQSGTLTMVNLTNRFDGSYYVRKNWMDGSNKYNLRPKEITVKLQRKTSADGAAWEDIPWEESFGNYNQSTGKWTGLPSVASNENGTRIVSITLNAGYVIRNTKNNSWDYTFTNLPTQDKLGNAYTYRWRGDGNRGSASSGKNADGWYGDLWSRRI